MAITFHHVVIQEAERANKIISVQYSAPTTLHQ